MLNKSIPYIHKGSAQDFVNYLKDDVLSHPVVNHDYLKRLASGTVSDVDAAVRDYAHQYSFYSMNFVDYVRAVMSNTTDENILKPLQENLDEELGVDGHTNVTPHTELFAEFKKNIGIDSGYEDRNPATLITQIWSKLFLEKCSSPVAAIGVGALGLGTEFIVPHFYPYIIESIEERSSFDNKESFFFRLHVECDLEHGNETIEVSKYLAEKNNENREALRFGAISALNLRQAFYDNQLARVELI